MQKHITFEFNVTIVHKKVYLVKFVEANEFGIDTSAFHMLYQLKNSISLKHQITLICD